MPAMFIIHGPDGAPRRKVFCPSDEIGNQLAVDETYEAADPLVDGFGILTDVPLPAGDQR